MKLCMTLSAFAPMFGLFALKGVDAIADKWLWIACGSLIFLPSLVLVWRFISARNSTAPKPLVVGQVENSQWHLLTYLFATFLPFYRQDLADTRDVAAILTAAVLVTFLFWHLNLHYANVFLAIFGYRLHTIRLSDSDNPYAGRTPIVVVTRRRSLVQGEVIRGYRISDTLLFKLPRNKGCRLLEAAEINFRRAN